MKIGSLPVEPALGVAPMAGMTDTAFRRLVKRHGGCGLVVSEMVSSEGLVRGIDRTLEYAEYTEEERRFLRSRRRSSKMAGGRSIVEGWGEPSTVNRGPGRKFQTMLLQLMRDQPTRLHQRAEPGGEIR